jgi:preprotein translocase subunit SecD
MSPQARPQSRRPRGLVVSLIIVVAVSFGSLAGVLAARWSPRLGLDLAGGFSVVYKPAHKTSQANLNEAVNILTNRVNGLGVSGAEVNTQGDEIVVQVPDVKNPNEVLNAIGQTAQLLFRPALCEAPPYVEATETKKGQKAHKIVSPGALPSTCPQANLIVTSNIVGDIASTTGNPYPNALDTTLEAYPSTTPAQDAKEHNKTVLLPGLPGSGGVRYLAGPAELTGHIVKSAIAQLTSTGEWVVNISLTKDGSKAWDTMAEKYFHEIIVIELDGVVQSAPLTLPGQATFTSFDGAVQISGSFTQTSAKNLAVALNYGTLPVRLVQLTTQTVSPTLGRSSLDAGLGAGIAGLILVLLYTIFYYRLLGIVVVSGLAVTGAFLWSIISALGHTSAAPSFDLAGVTGIIVSIGITVDSYIVYFERLKDETRAGRTVRTSLDRGFRSAFRTVLAADFVSLLAAVLLYWLAVGEVKGFAFFLGLSTLLDVFVTYFFTRPLVALLGRSDRLTKARGIGINQGLAMPAGSES